MATPDQKRSPGQVLEAIAQLQYRNNEILKELIEQACDSNRLLEHINRRLWAQNIMAWIQLIGLLLTVLLYVLLVIGILGLPSPFKLLGLGR